MENERVRVGREEMKGLEGEKVEIEVEVEERRCEGGVRKEGGEGIGV